MAIMVKDLINDLEKGGDRVKEHLKDKKEPVQQGFPSFAMGLGAAGLGAATATQQQIMLQMAQERQMMAQSPRMFGQAIGGL